MELKQLLPSAFFDDPHPVICCGVGSSSGSNSGGDVDASEFLSWLLHQLHVGLGGGVQGVKRGRKKKKMKHNNNDKNGGGGRSIIYDTFGGM